jgi:hypothetical protein
MIASQRDPVEEGRLYFLVFIHNVLSGDQRYFPLVEKVLQETRLYVDNKKDIFQLDRSMFHNVIWLAQTCGAFIKQINMTAITDEDLDVLHHVLEDHQHTINRIFCMPLRNPCVHCSKPHAEYACDEQIKSIKEKLAAR